MLLSWLCIEWNPRDASGKGLMCDERARWAGAVGDVSPVVKARAGMPPSFRMVSKAVHVIDAAMYLRQQQGNQQIHRSAPVLPAHQKKDAPLPAP